MKPYLKWLVLGLFLSVLLGSGIILTTESGLRFAISKGGQFLPGTLTIKEVHGTLLGPIRLQQLDYQITGTRISSASIDITWNPFALFKGRVHINQLQLQNIEIDHSPAESDSAAASTPAPGNVHLPVELFIDNLAVDKLEYRSSGATGIIIDRIQLSAQLGRKQFNLAQLEVDAPQGSISVTGRIDPDSLSGKLLTTWEVNLEGYKPFEGLGTITGNIREIQLEQQLNKPVQAQLSGSVLNLLNRPSWQATVDFTALNPRDIRIDMPELMLTSSIKAKGDLARFSAALGAQTQLEQVGNIDLIAQLDGNYVSPWQIGQLTISLPDHGSRVDARGDMAINNKQLKYAFNGQWQQLKWPLQENPKLSSESGSFQFSGFGLDYLANIKALFQVPIDEQRTSSGSLTLNAQGNTEGLNINSLAVESTLGKLAANGGLQWQLPTNSSSSTANKPDSKQATDQAFIDTLQYRFNGRWQQLAWPLNETRLVKSQSGEFQISGKGMDYQTQVAADLEVPDLPTGSVNLKGQGNNRMFTFDSLAITTEQGSLSGSGNVRWLPAIRWQTQLQASQIDISRQWPEWSGRFDASFNSQGTVTDKQITAELDLVQLQGTLRGFPVAGNGKFKIAPGYYELEKLTWRSGDAVLQAEGRLDEQWQMHWSINADDLGSFWPDLHGKTNVAGKISGEKRHPRLEMTLAASDLTLEKISMASINGLFDIDLADRSPSKIDLNIDQLNYGDQAIDTLVLSTEGTIVSQRWQLLLKRGEENVRLGLAGGYRNNAWQGQLEEFQLNMQQAGNWNLEKPADIYLSTNAARSNDICLKTEQGQVCAKVNWQADSATTLETSFQHMSTSLFSWLMPDFLRWQDAFSGHLVATFRSDQSIALNSNIKLGPGRIEFPQQGLENISFGYQQGELTAVTDQTGTRLDFNIVLDSSDKLFAELKLPGYNTLAAPQPEQVLEGQLIGSYRELGLVSLFVPEIQDLSGLFNTDIKLTGTWANPNLSGTASLDNSKFTIPNLGTRINNINITLSTRGTEVLDIKGSADSGEGNLALTGEWQLDANQGWPASLHLEGKNFEVTRRPGLWIIASPNLDIKTQGKELTVIGKVAIPRTDIELKGLPEATITTSSDVIIVQQQELESTTATRPWTVNAEIRVLPEDRVYFSGFGLSGRVAGDLNIIKSGDKPVVGTGRLEIVEGKYQAYGMDLVIEQGQLIFANSPLDNPAIDIRATRTITGTDSTIIAGLHAQGRLKNATLTLYSEPPMGDTDILSYLLLGRPAGETTGTDSDLLVAAAAAIGTSEAFLATKRLAQSIGFEDVRINRTGLVMGKSLSDRLYLSYEIGLLQPQNTLQLRYTLTENWTVKVETSEGQSADLLYTIER